MRAAEAYVRRKQIKAAQPHLKAMATTKNFHTSDLWLEFLERELNPLSRAAEIIGKARVPQRAEG